VEVGITEADLSLLSTEAIKVNTPKLSPGGWYHRTRPQLSLYRGGQGKISNLSPSEVGIPEPDSLLFAEEVMKIRNPIPISLQDAVITGHDLNFLSTKVRRVDLQVACGGCQWHHRSRSQPTLHSGHEG
jgi:hypothetical protein